VKAKDIDPLLGDIKASRDKTQREREYLKTLRNELEERTNSGKQHLTIKYKNGIPLIVKKQKN